MPALSAVLLTYFQFPIQSVFLIYRSLGRIITLGRIRTISMALGRTSTAAYYWTISDKLGQRTLPKIWVSLFLMRSVQFRGRLWSDSNGNKNWSGDEITNVNFFTKISHTYFKIPKRLPSLFNKLDDSQASTAHRIKSRIYESARNLYRGRRAVSPQTFTTRHSNRKLSIVMALSTTFTQCASEAAEFGKITQNKGHFAVHGHSKSPILVPIESSYTTSYYGLILT